MTPRVHASRASRVCFTWNYATQSTTRSDNRRLSGPDPCQSSVGANGVKNPGAVFHQVATGWSFCQALPRLMRSGIAPTRRASPTPSPANAVSSKTTPGSAEPEPLVVDTLHVIEMDEPCRLANQLWHVQVRLWSYSVEVPSLGSISGRMSLLWISPRLTFHVKRWCASDMAQPSSKTATDRRARTQAIVALVNRECGQGADNWL